MTVNDQDHKFHGTVLLVLGDTLASNDLAGFKVGVGFSLRICRDCMATTEMIQLKVSLKRMFSYFLFNFILLQFKDEFILRDCASHDYYCSLLEGPFGSEDSVTYGINSISCLNKIKHFHVANFQMPQDVMHVILEGILPLETGLMLASFIGDNFFTLELLNDRIENFSYSRTEARNKPRKPFNKAHLIGPKPKLHLSGLFYESQIQHVNYKLIL